MKLKTLLLSLLLSLPIYAQDCVPASLKFLADELGTVHSIEDWKKACETTDVGTDLDKIVPAWNKLTSDLRVKLVPVYVIPRIGMQTLDDSLQPFRNVFVDREIIQQRFKYFWIGLHEDPSQPNKLFVHSAVVMFFEDGVVMISPNSVDAEGAMLVQKFNYQTFLSHTFVVFDLEVVREEKPSKREKVNRPTVLL